MANGHQNITPSFLLEKQDVMLVKPSKPTPSGGLSLSSIDNDPNLEILCQTIYAYRSNIADNPSIINDDNHVYTRADHDIDPALVIKEALSKALVYYYPLAGKLKRNSDGRLQINCSADGVPFLVATANCYHPPVLQVTKFSHGGFTIGMGLSHSVCDGFGAGQFFRALAEFSSGKSEPSVKLVWEREKLVGIPSEEPFRPFVDEETLATSPYLPTTDLLHACFHVSSESIKRLKFSLQEECGTESLDQSFTTIEVLGAYVWRTRFRALELNSNGKTHFCLAMGIRKLLNPPLPDGYYGNAFDSANVVLTGGELDEIPLSKVAKLIKESKKVASKSDYIMKLLGILEIMIKQQQNMKSPASGACMVLTDWRQLGLLDEVDFGWKDPVNILPVPWNMFGYVDLCIFLPPSKVDPSMKGGVRVLVSLPRPAMAKFEKEMDALKVGVHA